MQDSGTNTVWTLLKIADVTRQPLSATNSTGPRRHSPVVSQ